MVAGAARYAADGGNDSYNAIWDLTKNLASQMWEGLVSEIKSPCQLVMTVKSMIMPEAAEQEAPESAVKFDKVCCG